MHEAHRFVHRPVTLATGVHWDFTGLMREIKEGLTKAGEWCGANSFEVASIGADTWGVDFGLVHASGRFTVPRCYRDPVAAIAMAEVTGKHGAYSIYEATGIQPMTFNTLYQLVAQGLAHQQAGDERLLFMPNLVLHLLGGEAKNETTIASTSQVMDARTAAWSSSIIDRIVPGARGLLAADVVPSGAVVGHLDPTLADELRLSRSVRLIAPAGHDTACAAAAVPATHGESWCYLSSGTWSLLGVELDEPMINEAAFKAGFSNELGVPRRPGARATVRFQKNIAGLWLVQECKRAFEVVGIQTTYENLVAAAGACTPFELLIDVNAPIFAQPGQMPEKIAAYAARTNQHVPTNPGEFIRACLDSLALEYARSVTALEQLVGRKFAVLHLVGGGGKNTLLNQMTADATGKRVVVGPFEGTAAGNILVQSIGLGGTGGVRDLAHLRAIVAASSELKAFDPIRHDAWREPTARYESLLRQS